MSGRASDNDAGRVGAAGALLEVRDLQISFSTEDGLVHAVDGLDMDLQPGEVLALVGESGSGKSATALALMGLNRGPNATISGTARFEGTELISASDEQLRGIRGNRVSMIFQDPASSLNPVYNVSDQIVEQIRAHRDVEVEEARGRAIELLDAVGMPDPDACASSYPHELSGGMRQRAMIAMALANDPTLLVADEPTAAVDVTTQAQILSLLQDLQDRLGMAVILITHDLGVVAENADRVMVMYAGRIVEEGTVEEIFFDPAHPYTWGLLGSLPQLDAPRDERLAQIAGTPPSLVSPPRGCHFRERCPHAFDRCLETPPLEQRLADSPAHRDRCWLGGEQKRELRSVDGRIGLRAPREVGSG